MGYDFPSRSSKSNRWRREYKKREDIKIRVEAMMIAEDYQDNER